jgi:hypothetical protein
MTRNAQTGSRRSCGPGDDIQPRTGFALGSALPVFLFHGTSDQTVPASHVHLYARAIPRATVRLVEHGDHQLNNDLREVARDIRSLYGIKT